MAGRKQKPRKTRQKVKLWLALADDGAFTSYEVHPSQPRIKMRKSYYGGSGETHLISKARGSRYNNGSIAELCTGDVSKALGLNLRGGEAVEVTFTFGKVLKLGGK